MSNRCKKAIKCGSALGCASLGVVMALSFSPFAQGSVHGAFADEGGTSSEQPQQQNYDFKIGKNEVTVLGNLNTFLEVGITSAQIKKIYQADMKPGAYDEQKLPEHPMLSTRYTNKDGKLVSFDTSLTRGDSFSNPLKLRWDAAQSDSSKKPGLTNDELMTTKEFATGAQPNVMFKIHNTDSGETVYKTFEKYKDELDDLDFTIAFENNKNINEQYDADHQPALVVRDDNDAIIGKKAINIIGYHLTFYDENNTEHPDEHFDYKNWESFIIQGTQCISHGEEVFVDKEGNLYNPTSESAQVLTKDEIKKFLDANKPYAYITADQTPVYYKEDTQELMTTDADSVPKKDVHFLVVYKPNAKVLHRNGIPEKFIADFYKSESNPTLPELPKDDLSQTWGMAPTVGLTLFHPKDKPLVEATLHEQKHAIFLFDLSDYHPADNFLLPFLKDIAIDQNSSTGFADKQVTCYPICMSNMQDVCRALQNVDNEAYNDLVNPMALIDGVKQPLKVSDVLERYTDDEQLKNDYTKPGTFIIKKDFLTNVTGNTYARALDKLIFNPSAPLFGKFLDTKDSLISILRNGNKDLKCKPYVVRIGYDIASMGDKISVKTSAVKRAQGPYYDSKVSVSINDKEIPAEAYTWKSIDDDNQDRGQSSGEFKVKIKIINSQVKDLPYVGEYTTPDKHLIGVALSIDPQGSDLLIAGKQYTSEKPCAVTYIPDGIPDDFDMTATVQKKVVTDGHVSYQPSSLQASIDKAKEKINLTGTPEKDAEYQLTLQAKRGDTIIKSDPVSLRAVPEPKLAFGDDVITGFQVGKKFTFELPFTSANIPADARLEAKVNGNGGYGIYASVSQDKTKVILSGKPYRDGDAEVTLSVKKGYFTTLTSVTKKFKVAAASAPAPVPSPTPEPGKETPVPSFDQATKRIAGETSEDTMQQIVQTAFPDPVKEVVLATSESYWDTLSANSLAGSLNAPVLLTHHNQLPAQTIAELQRLKTSKVVVCGGENAISNDVVAQLKGLNIEVERVAGKMASDTANDIAKKLDKSDTAIVATSWGYEDALSAASYAYAQKAPIFLANYNTATLDASSIQTMKDKGVKKVYIVGGKSVVSPEVEAQLQEAGITVERIAGETAYDTNAQLATKLILLGMSANNMAIATGWGYTDALAGAALCGKQHSVMVLADNTNQTAINEVVAANKHAIQNYYIFGGTSVVGDGVTDALKGVFTGKDA